jgi:maltose-binding protein MalE
MYKKMIILVFMLLVLSATPILALEEVTIDAQASSVFLTYGSSIGKNTNTITCTAWSDLVDFYSLSISMSLQKYEDDTWVTLETWSDSDYDITLDVMGGYPRSSGLYRVKSTHKAGGETRTSYSGNFSI